ncbi:hypothetical protein QP028_05100 [Corynebacterium suedekumii]|nr:hypothetical protein QP028_05100 [Corynebacterium suedekumii]
MAFVTRHSGRECRALEGVEEQQPRRRIEEQAVQCSDDPTWGVVHRDGHTHPQNEEHPEQGDGRKPQPLHTEPAARDDEPGDDPDEIPDPEQPPEHVGGERQDDRRSTQ